MVPGGDEGAVHVHLGTYVRFPMLSDPMVMSIWLQAHHLETEFYDKYYQPDAYQENIRSHMGVWHSAR